MENEIYGFTLTKISKKKYRVAGNSCPSDMVITIKEYKIGYRAYCNYSLSSRTNDNLGYQAMHFCPTIEETITHLLMSLKPNGNYKWVNCK